MRRLLGALLLVAGFLASCAKGTGSKPSADSPQPQAGSTPAATGTVQALLGPRPTPGEFDDVLAAAKATSVSERLKEIEDRLDALELSESGVSTEESNYAVVRTQHGPFAVISRGVEPYLDGYKVRLDVGNLTGASFHGVKLKASWGRWRPDTGIQDEKTRNFDLTTVFLPGSYTRVELVLTPAKAEEIKTIWVGLEFHVMSLRRSR